MIFPKSLIIFVFMATGVAIFLGCEPPITFHEPQPPDTERLTEFPKDIQGKYLGKSNGSTVEITERLMRRTHYNDFKVHLNQLDSSVTLSGDTLTEFKSNNKTIVKREGDSITAHIEEIDTIFRIDKTHI